MIFKRRDDITSTLVPSHFSESDEHDLKGKGPFKELIYCSRVAPQLGVNGVYDILAQCTELNAQNNIGGVLMFNNRFFLQAIEGTVDVVDATFARVSRDIRHHSLLTVSESVHKSRRWSAWRMTYLGHNETQRQLLNLHSSFGVFDPTAMTSLTLIKLMHTFFDELGAELSHV